MLKLSLKFQNDLKIILVACIYFVAAVAGHQLSFENDHLILVWPPSGIALALLIIMGRSAWPGVTIGALLANIIGFWNTGTLSTTNLISISSVIAIGYTLEALAGNYMVKMAIPDKDPFSKTINAFRFLFIAFTISLIGSVANISVLYFTGVLTYGQLLQTWLSFWVSNVAGIFLITPLILSFRHPIHVRFEKEKVIETTAFLLIIIGFSSFLTIPSLQDTLIFALPLIVMPFLLWLAFRFNLSIALSVVLLIAFAATYYTVAGVGPFIMDTNFTTMIMLQIFIGVISITTLILSTTVRERNDVQEQLKSFNEQLESKVVERTRELNDEINTRREAEQKLTSSNRELRKINEELDNFVYSVSHDLRAPIASVLGLINIAQLENDPSKVGRYLSMINNCAVQQDNFIKEILDQSRNSRLEVACEKVEFDTLIDEVFQQLNANSTNNNVEKHVKVNQEIPFYSDKWRLKVIINNLLSNAIRYRNGHDPVIDINVDVNHKNARVAIKDNGRGIEKEHIGKVWKMFYRATDDNAGSGLGLYIVKQTVDKLSGNIKINSRPGKGTTVTFEVPALLNVN